jgi:phosphoglycolate phosphatase
MTLPKLCIFDCDGTLVDGQHGITAAMASAFAAEGLPGPSAAAVKRVVGLALADAIALLHPGATARLHTALAQHYVAAFGALRHAGRTQEWLYPGVLQGLQAIEEAGWLLGMATGKSYRGALATLSAHGLQDRFATIQTADRAAGKPAPDMIQQALADTGVQASRAIMIGDTTYDIEMARNAGVVAMGVDWGYHDGAELLAAGAAVVVHDFAALQELIEYMLETTTA